MKTQPNFNPQKPLPQQHLTASPIQAPHLEGQQIGLLHHHHGIKKSPVKYSYLHTEDQQEYTRNWNIFWLECLSMFIFIYASTCSKPPTGLDLHFFVGILLAIPICAKQTGANLNPGVSFSMTFKAQGQGSRQGQGPFWYSALLWIYVKAQIWGAVAAMAVAVVLNDQVDIRPVFPEYWAGGIRFQDTSAGSISRVILSQAVGMFIFIFLILYATGPYSFIPNNGAKYLYISIFLYIGRKFAPSSSSQINPALTIAQALVGIPECNFQGLKYFILWVVGDMLGVFLAAWLYLYSVEPMRKYLERYRTEKVMVMLKDQHKKVIEKSRGREKEKVGNQAGESYTKKLQYF